eukprot:4619509-Alexandrium_andersonii.AAC.1
MSASLVGSEMCIRDRVRESYDLAVLLPVRTKVGRGVLRGGASWSETASVSYTHLTLPTICSV